MSKHGVLEGPFDFEITRVGCIIYHLGLAKTGLSSKEVLILCGLNNENLLYTCI